MSEPRVRMEHIVSQRLLAYGGKNQRIVSVRGSELHQRNTNIKIEVFAKHVDGSPAICVLRCDPHPQCPLRRDLVANDPGVIKGTLSKFDGADERFARFLVRSYADAAGPAFTFQLEGAEQYLGIDYEGVVGLFSTSDGHKWRLHRGKKALSPAEVAAVCGLAAAAAATAGLCAAGLVPVTLAANLAAGAAGTAVKQVCNNANDEWYVTKRRDVVDW